MSAIEPPVFASETWARAPFEAGAAAERDRIRQLPLIRALSDPGSILPRLPDESVPFWQLRAVLDLLGGGS